MWALVVRTFGDADSGTYGHRACGYWEVWTFGDVDIERCGHWGCGHLEMWTFGDVVVILALTLPDHL